MSSVLIANRGEIAVRVIRACRALGLRTVALYTANDAAAAHLRRADEAHELTGELGYLDPAAIVELAARTGCALVHPGYGFLSENAGFARLCEAAGIGFVGPTSEVLAQFGDKAQARKLAESADVPVLRATAAGVTLDEAAMFLDSLGAGAAVMVKAAAGGGGRGMRVVHRPDDLPEAFERCASEAARAFGDGDLYVEQLLPQARHVEVQVLGDGTGAVTHFWDRECSVQRRHQKLVEIAPCPTLTAEQRAPLLDAACRMAAAVGYRGLGTFEFLVDATDPGRWFFLEANPRIQVEHTVTEEITGVDLVVAQLEVAAGATLAQLGLTQDDVPEPRGIAIQARVNLERLDADGTARATTGRIDRFEVPTGRGVRVDTHGEAGLVADGRYDSLLAKVVVTTTRGGLPEAAAATRAALAELTIDGPGTNVALLTAILAHPAFGRGEATTRFVDEHLAELQPELDDEPEQAGDPAEVVAPFAGTVLSLAVAPGDHVAAGAPVAVLESMKMEHVVAAGVSGTVLAVEVAVGDTVAERRALVRLDPDDVQVVHADDGEAVDPDHVRPDLSALLERHAMTLDERRPAAVARRHATGHRTARENVADLVDDGSFVEYGALTVAAQQSRRSMADLIANSPADGMVCGIGRINGDVFGDAAQAVVLAYDYTVFAGTQGYRNHAKTDRMLELAERRALPVILFAEGGGGRPGDSDAPWASGLHVSTFTTMGRLSGRVPTVGVVSGRCFAGNAALLGCCDVVVATRDATVGMAGPAMIEGGGLGRFRPEEVGPVSVQEPNGVLDVVVADEAAAVAVARRYLSYFQGPLAQWRAPDQRRLRHVVPENRMRVYDVRAAIDVLADEESVLELRRAFGRSVVTALVRIEGRPLGLIANDPAHLGGAVDSDSADKITRFLRLCDAHGLPVVSLCDTPGFMVGPDAERTATVRHFSRIFVAGAHLSVPVVAVVLRKAYGLGAMAMVGGSFRVPVATVAWPTGEAGPMGLEGAVRLGYRRELEAIEDPAERQRLFEDLLAESYERGKAVHAAAVFEIDDVIDPARTRALVVASLAGHEPRPSGMPVDPW